MITGLKDDFEEMKKDVEEIKDNFGKMEQEVVKLHASMRYSKLQPYTKNDIDELKKLYKIQYQKHSINKIDENCRIVMKAVKVQDFAVKLKISETRPVANSFKNETRQHFEQLKGMTGKDIILNELLNHDDRVVLVCGVAGLGKTVLTKQIAFLWANNEIFTKFTLCIIMECRDINHFIANKGADLKRHQIFSEFLKTKFRYDLVGGESTLLILDGIDELEDISSNDSMIWQLLDVKQAEYTKAKIILTGRPHVEGKLEGRGRDIGGLHRCEIQGLNDEQIKDYVEKFASCNEEIVKITNSIYSSKEYVKILSVPAFLNSMCCVTLLSDGQTVNNTAELYIWVLYLLLKEHVEKEQPSQKTCSQIFEEYTSDIWALCEICHQLLSENKIIFEGDVRSQLLKCGKGTEFLEGLFADISECRTKKYQFKHLTMMEFLSAVHICRMKNRIDIIEHNLKNEFYQVVIFTCELVGGYKYDGIIKDMFGNDEELKAINVEHFLPSVLRLVAKQEQQQPHEILQLSIEIIMCFINKDVTNKNFIISTVKTLPYKMNELDEGGMRKVSALCDHLSNSFQCNEEDLKEALKNFLYEWVKIDDIKSLTCIKYLPNVEVIQLWRMRINSFQIQCEANAVAKCKSVRIQWCELADEELVESMAKEVHQLDHLWIECCKLNKCSFINICKWALASVQNFRLWYIANVEHSWWRELVDAIQKLKDNNNGIFTMRELNIRDCTQKMSKEMQMKIVQCGITLTFDSKAVEPPSQSVDAKHDPQPYNNRPELAQPNRLLRRCNIC